MYLVKGYNSSVMFFENQEIPVLITVTGIDNIDDSSNTYKDVLNVYSIFDFKSAVLDAEYAFNVRFFFL